MVAPPAVRTFTAVPAATCGTRWPRSLLRLISAAPRPFTFAAPSLAPLTTKTTRFPASPPDVLDLDLELALAGLGLELGRALGGRESLHGLERDSRASGRQAAGIATVRASSTIRKERFTVYLQRCGNLLSDAMRRPPKGCPCRSKALLWVWLRLGSAGQLFVRETWKKSAIAPAEPATTSTAQISSKTSITRPVTVSGFFSCEDTVRSCTVVKKRASPTEWISLPAACRSAK
jgi:hypothetical protein